MQSVERLLNKAVNKIDGRKYSLESRKMFIVNSFDYDNDEYDCNSSYWSEENEDCKWANKYCYDEINCEHNDCNDFSFLDELFYD